MQFATNTSAFRSFFRARVLSRRLLGIGFAVSSTFYALRAEVLSAVLSTPLNERDSIADDESQSTSLPEGATRTRRELFFIDADVADPRAFWLAAPSGATVICIPAGVDSWEFMAHEAGQFRGLAAIHIVSHGERGTLLLNQAKYTAADLAKRKVELQDLGRALSKNGDIFLYGCQVGAGVAGQELVETISAATGADVAASNDNTGGAAQGGNWNLEIVTGEVNRERLLGADGMAGYDCVLHTASVNTVAQLKAAVASAIGDGAADTITITGNITFASASDTIAINVTDGQTLSIVGGGFTLSGNNLTRVLDVTSGNVSISNLTISNGFLTGAGGITSGSAAGGAGGDSLGAGIRNAGTLSLAGCTITGHKAAGGGGGGGGELGGGGSGGGGGGFGSTFGGTGGANYVSPGGSASAGTGGNGAGFSTMIGRGGTTIGGAGASFGSGYTNGGNGGTANNLSISIGGGGGGGGYNFAGGRGGHAAAGIYNTGTITATGCSITNNIGGGGGGGGGTGVGATAAGDGGAGGNGIGAIWNAGGLVQIDSGTNTTLATANTGGGGSGGQAIKAGSSDGAAGSSTSQILTTSGGTTNTSYTPPNAAPTVSNLNGDSGNFTEGGSVVLVDSGSNATVADGDSADFNAGNVTVAIVTNRVSGEDVLAIVNQGSGAGQIGVSGSNVTYGGTTIGTYTGGTGTNNLVVTLNGSSTPTSAQALLRNLTYNNSNSIDPNSSTRTVRVTVNDGDGGTSSNADISVSVTGVNDAPTASATGGTPTFTENGSAVDLFSGVSISAIESGQSVDQLVFTVTNVADGSSEVFGVDGSTFGLVNGGSGTTTTNSMSYSVSVSAGTATVTISKVAGISAAAAQTLIDGITYRNTSENPTTSGNRVVTLTSVRDTGGTANSGVDTTSVSIAATVTVAATNDAPTVANAIANQNATEDSAFSFQFASNTFSDAEGNTLSYTAQLAGGGALPSWLGFTAGTRTFAGTPTNGDVGTISIDVIANDGNGGTVTDTFNITVANTNDAPTVANAIADQNATEDSAFSFQFASNTFADVDVSNTLSYTAQLAGGGALPSWLGFTAGTRTFAGTPTNSDVGTVSIDVIANDSNGGTVTDTFSITVANTNDAPTVANAIPNQNATEDSAFSFQFAANTFADVDVGATLTYTAQLAGGGALPSWLGFTAGTRTFAGTPTNGDVGTVSIDVIANDGNGGTVTDTFNITVANTNDAPTVANAIADQNATEDSAFSFQFASNTFADVDVGNTLSYTAQLAGGGTLPSWLGFTAGTRTFAGTPTNSDVGTVSIDVIANDSNGGTVTDTFNITVANTNDAPTVANAIADQNATEDSAFSFQFASNTFADVDAGATLTYTAQLAGGGALPSWLSFTAGTRTFAGTPTNGDVGTVSIDVIANDGLGGTVTDTFNITVANTNDAPTVANAIADQNATEDSAFSFQFASNTFADVDAGASLTYTAQLAGGGALPSWLSFTAGTRTFAGTPTNGDVGTISIDVIANDSNGGTVTDTFDIVISSINDAPTITAPGSISVNEDVATAVTGISFADVDAGSSSVTATLSVGSGTLAATSGGGVTVGGSGTTSLTLTGSLANINAFIAASNVTFTTSSNATSNVTLTVGINDGGSTGSGGAQSASTTVTLSVSAVNDAPAVTAPASVTVTEDVATAVTGISFSDGDAGGSSVIATLSVGSGTLAATSGGGVTVGGSGTTSLALTGSIANLNAFVAGSNVSFTTVSNSTSSVTLTISINDNGNTGSGGAQTGSGTTTVNVTGVNDAPVLAASGGVTAFTEGNNATSTPVAIDSGLTLSDADSATLAGATVSVTGNFQSGQDGLDFTNTSAITYGNIGASYNSGTGVLTLTSAGATATVAQWQAALRAVTYTNSSDTPNTSNRTLSFVANDGAADSSTDTKTVSVTSTNDTPVVSSSGGVTAFTEGNNATSTPVAIDSGLTLSDADSATLASATVSVTGNFQSGQDGLGFTNTSAITYGNIGASYNSGTGVLTLTSAGATATVAQWQAALRAVTYTNSSDTPNTSNRTLSFVANDGVANSTDGTKTVSVAATNDFPTDIALSVSSVSQSGGSNAAVGTLSTTDADDSTFTYSLVSGTGSANNESFNISGATLRANDAAALAAGAYSVRVSSADSGSATFERAFTITVVDDVAPNSPSTPDLATASDSGGSSTDNITSITTPTFTGTAEVNSTVELFRAGSVSLGTTTADGSGNWSLTVGTALSAGTHSITATAKDVANNTGVASGALSVTIDTTAPASPSTPDLATASDSGGSSTDNITNITTPTFTGTAEANSTVQIFRAGSISLGTTTADGSGNWSLTVSSALSDGTYSITAATTDTAGQTSASSAALSVTIDTAAPAVPALTAISDDTGTSNNDQVTSDTTLLLSGTAEANQTVRVFRNAAQIGTVTANGGGAWSFDYTSTTLAGGTHTFTATASDVAGNASSASAAFLVEIDIVTPTAPIITSIGNDTGASTTDGVTSDATLSLSGTADAGSIITLSRGGVGVIGSATADGGGVWTFDYTGTTLPDGSHVFTAFASDSAGNASAVSADFPITVDTLAPGIGTQPTGGTYTATGSFAMNVVATDATTLSYQWYLAANPLSDTINRVGSTTTTVTHTNIGTVGFGGDYTVRITDLAGNTTTSNIATVVVNKADQTIDFPAIDDQLAIVNPFVIGATASSGFSVTFSVVSGPATVSGNTVTVTGAGSVTLRASQAGDLNYNPATADRTFNVTKATATVVLGNLSQNYNGSPRSATATTTPSGLTVVFTYDGSSTAPTNAGTYAVVAAINDNLYQGTIADTLTIAKIGQTVTFNSVGTVTVGTPAALSATASSGLGVTFSLVSGNGTVSGTSFTANDANPITLRASQTGNANYNPASVDQVVASITKLSQTITFTAPTDKSRTAAPFTLNATASSSLSVTYAVQSGPATVSGNTVTLTGIPGTVTIVASQTGNAVYAAASDVTRSFNVTADYASPLADGFASTVTGGTGAGSQAFTVLTAADFRTAAESATTAIITVVGTLNLGSTSVAVKSNKTIQGADASATLVGNLNLASTVSNVIIRGLNFSNPGTTIVSGSYTDGGDGITIAGARNIFVTHCTFFDCADHAMKITNSADNITVSWCEFYYTGAQTVHKYSMLIGNPGTETVRIRVSLHHNLWSSGVGERMPYSTFGYVHFYNNVFASPGNVTGSEAADRAQFLSERNVYTGVNNPLRILNVSASSGIPDPRILALGNVYTGTTGTAPYSGTDSVFTPAYSYEALPTSDVTTVVNANAGNNVGAAYSDDVVGLATITGPSGTVPASTAFTLTAVPSNFTPTTYQWRRNNIAISGATSVSYALGNAQDSDAGVYTVAIGLASGDMVVSSPFTVTVSAAPRRVVITNRLNGFGGGALSGWCWTLLMTLLLVRSRRSDGRS